jgi:hypothetical protein
MTAPAAQRCRQASKCGKVLPLFAKLYEFLLKLYKALAVNTAKAAP